MSNFNKWNRDEVLDSDKLNVVLFVSRNKDNKHLKNFTERRNAFTTTREFKDIKDQFKAFVEAGQPGEFSRMYTSVNPRSNSKTFKALQHKMLKKKMLTAISKIGCLTLTLLKVRILKKWFTNLWKIYCWLTKTQKLKKAKKDPKCLLIYTRHLMVMLLL